MKSLKYIVACFFALIALALSSGCVATSSSSYTGPGDQVIVTRNPADVVGKKRVCEVSAVAQMVFGSPQSLRVKATDKLKQEAVKNGATIVLIEKDEFAPTPINNVSLVGVAYR